MDSLSQQSQRALSRRDDPATSAGSMTD